MSKSVPEPEPAPPDVELPVRTSDVATPSRRAVVGPTQAEKARRRALRRSTRKLRWRVAVPPAHGGVTVAVRPTVQPAIGYTTGLQLIDANRWSMTGDVHVFVSRRLGRIGFVDDGIDRNLVSGGADLAGYRDFGGLRLGVHGGFTYNIYRQQWRDIDAFPMPLVGIGVDWTLIERLGWGVRMRARVESELGQTVLVAPSGIDGTLFPAQFQFSILMQFPGLGDPFSDLPTLHE